MTPTPSPRQGGYTLVETLITCVVISIVLAAAFPMLPVFFRESNVVQNTYQSVDQLVLASEVVTRYVHEAVAPSSSTTPFLSASANAATFYANTGNANGPQKAVMQVATAGSSRTFQLNLFTPTANSCPGISAGILCTYGASSQSFLLINYLTNGTGGSPVFTYALQGGEVCGGAPPSPPTTTLSLAAGTGATTLHVPALAKAVPIGDTIFLGSGPNAQSVTASAASAAGTTTITVSALSAAAASGTAVYDSALTTVPNTLPTTLKTAAGANATTLQVPSLPSPISTGDTIVVGTGATAQTVTAQNSYGTSGSTTNISVSALPRAAAANSSVYDSSCSAGQVAQIVAVSLSLQATKNPGGQPTGYQSLAYMLSPTYNAAVG
jgi:type II secretory pathway pseudopilin PulG